MRALGIPLLLGLAACPIPPDFTIDAGTDAGVDAGFDAGVDAGVDGGASGTIGATLATSSNASATPLAWSGSDLQSTTVDLEGATGPSQVTLSASNASSGSFKLTIGSLVPGSTSGEVLSISYQPASGPDSWLCNLNNPCGGSAMLSSYDGKTIVGSFGVSFPADGFGTTAQLNPGNFNVVLP